MIMKITMVIILSAIRA